MNDELYEACQKVCELLKDTNIAYPKVIITRNEIELLTIEYHEEKG